MTTRPKPPTQPAEDDLFFRLLDGVIHLIGWTLRYWARRTRRQPIVGLLYLVVVLPAVGLLIQHLRMALAVATAPPFTRPTPVWPLTTPLHDPAPLLLGGLIALVIASDRWLAWRAQARQRPAPPPAPSPDVCVLGRAYTRTWQPERNAFDLMGGELCALTAEHLRTHLLVVAPQGGGKTQSILKPLFFWTQRIGAACFVFDAKGDGQDWQPGWFDRTFDLTDPATSMRLNLWSGRTPRQAGERLGEALIDPQDTPAYFLNVAKDALAGLVAAHHAAFGQMPTLPKLLLYLRSAEARADLISELRRAGLADGSDAAADVLRVNQIADSKADVLGTLDTALTPLARGEVASLLAADDRGFRLDTLLQEGVRVRFVLPVAEYPRVAPILGRLVLAQFTDAVLSPTCNRELLKLVIVDEAENFITPAIAKGMAMARSNRGSYVLAMQNLHQIRDATLREDLLSVAGNKVVMAGVGNYDAEMFSKLFGAQELEYTSASSSQSTGTNTSRTTGRGQQGGGVLGGNTVSPHYQSSHASAASSSATTGTTHRYQVRPLFLPGEIRGLPAHHALIETRDNQGQVTPATLVHLDRALVDVVQESQQLRLYRQNSIPATARRPAPAPVFPAVSPLVDHGQVVREEPDGPEPMVTPLENAPPPLPDAWTVIAQRLASELQMADATIAHLIACAQQQGRTADYLADMLAYVRTDPTILAKAAAFRRLVEANTPIPPSASASTNTTREESA